MPGKRVTVDSMEHLKEAKKQVEQVKEISKLQEELQHKLIENIVILQKVQTDMAEKFSKLSDQISNLLVLFEMAARNFAGTPANQTNEKDKEFLDKIDKLLDQNKVLAKGLTMMEERLREKVYGASRPLPMGSTDDLQPSAMTKPLPRV
ncbi:hypothetical protein FJZ18_01175 [Candidatus Pacearchaeota archaeon]|nr:hypothetical protein [Candidatus Pacearchaeota archaeon]